MFIARTWWLRGKFNAERYIRKKKSVVLIIMHILASFSNRTIKCLASAITRLTSLEDRPTYYYSATRKTVKTKHVYIDAWPDTSTA